jgi:hypothetical protein
LPAINTPVSATATNTQAEDTVQNPTSTAPDPETRVVHVSLILKGVTFDPNVLYDGLNSAYGTVASTKDSVARGTYIFTIEA